MIFPRASPSSSSVLRPGLFSRALSSAAAPGRRPLSSVPTRVPTHAVVPPATRLSSCHIRTYKSRGLSRMASSLTLPRLPVFDAIAGHDPQSPAVIHCLSGRTFKYGEILPDVCRVRDRIYAAAGKSDIRGERVAFLIENSYDYVGMHCCLLWLIRERIFRDL